ncbi:MAG: hypothetical protein NTX21_00845 [Alphaproteobacteria bacterium]|nr:hypothetical protein [Alphaproteobacteria bacterium]
MSGGCGIECERGQCKVQSYGNGCALVETRKLHALAKFIIRYVAFMEDMLSRHRARGFRRSQSHMERSAKIPRSGKDGKVPDKVVPVPADDPAVATLADDLHANA